MNELLQKHCVPCEGGVPPLPAEEQQRLLGELGDGWEVVSGHHLNREFVFPAFEIGLDFVNRAGGIAEQEGHHPNIRLDRRRAIVEIWTHKIDGLTESDFILAAKLTDAMTNLATAKLVDVDALKGESHVSAGHGRLEDAERDARLAQLGPAWSLVENHHLYRTFGFADFVKALTFVNRVAKLAKEARHHPAIDLSWGKVGIELYTYPADGLTALDFDLAGRISAAYQPG